MKKLLVPFVASFGLSLGIATGVVVARTPKAPLHPVVQVAAVAPKLDLSISGKGIAPTSAPDSTAAGAIGDTANAVASTTPADSAAPANTTMLTSTNSIKKGVVTPSAIHVTQVVQHVSSSKESVPDGLPRVKVGSVPSTIAIPARTAPKTTADSLTGRRLAQVFGAMQAKDAARVLEQMDDTDVRAILTSLSSKQQAAILGSFPTQRAALILQATLRTASSGGGQ